MEEIILKTLEDINKLPERKNLKVLVVCKDGKDYNTRGYREGGMLFLFSPRSRRYGIWVSDDFLSDREIRVKLIIEEDKTERWRKGWSKIIEALEKSGLWVDLKKEYEIGLDIGYEKIKEANKRYWETSEGSLEERKQKRYNALLEIDRRIGTEFSISTLWQMNNEPKVKSMYFGKGKNEEIKAEIKRAIEEKKDYDICSYANYDVSFSYKAEQNKAWYSEEYKGYGNGHYYLAISHSQALFYEDD